MTVVTTSPAGVEDGASDASSEKRPTCLQRQLHKTRLCTQFVRGRCSFGTDCTYAHSCAEIRESPNLKGTKLCINFKKGLCTDPNCGFAHTEDDLRATDLFYKTTLCKWFGKGQCGAGDECRFAHGDTDLRPSSVNWMDSSSDGANCTSPAGTVMEAKERITKPKQAKKQNRKNLSTPAVYSKVAPNGADLLEPLYINVPLDTHAFMSCTNTQPPLSYLSFAGAPHIGSTSPSPLVNQSLDGSSGGALAGTRLASRVMKGSKSQLDYLQKRRSRGNSTLKAKSYHDTPDLLGSQVEAEPLIDGLGSHINNAQGPSLEAFSDTPYAPFHHPQKGFPGVHGVPPHMQSGSYLCHPMVPGPAPYHEDMSSEFYMAAETFSRIVAFSQSMQQMTEQPLKHSMQPMIC